MATSCFHVLILLVFIKKSPYINGAMLYNRLPNELKGLRDGAQIISAADEDLQCPNNYTSTTTLKKLKKQMFCQYDRWIRPVKNINDTVNVTISLYVKRLDFDEKTDILTVHSLFYVEWTDYHVMWKPSDFDGINVMKVSNWWLWQPDISIFNSVDETSYRPYMPYAMCFIYFDGKVLCPPSVTQTASCQANIKNWPYDSHTCELIFSSWTHMGEEVNITVPPNGAIEFKDANLNREWEVTSKGAYVETRIFIITDNKTETYPIIHFEFLLQRKSGSYAATVVIPAVVLMLVTLITYWMDSCPTDRLILASLGIFSHFGFLQYLANILPSNGADTPLLVTFYRDSLILTLMALMMASITRSLKSTSQPVPPWISGISDFVLQTRVGQIVIFHSLDPMAVAAASEQSGGEGADLVSSSANLSKTGWGTFTTFLNFIFFIVTLFTYMILLLGFIP